MNLKKYIAIANIYLRKREYLEKKHIINKTDPVYYIIRFGKAEGLLSMFFRTMGFVEFCEDHNYVPFIDLKNYKTQYNNGDPDDNAWEHFFTQPFHATEEMAYKSNYIIQGYKPGKDDKSKGKLFGAFFADNYSHNKEKKEYIFSHIDLSEEVKSLLAQEEARMPDLDHCVGVFCRGTDYVSLKPAGHPIQPSVSQLIEKIDKFLEKHPEILKIYLVTEDKNIYGPLKEYYADSLFVSFPENMIEWQNEKKFFAEVSAKKGIDAVTNAQKYLVKILLLSRCGYLVASKANGSAAAMAFNGDTYKDYYLFDVGVY